MSDSPPLWQQADELYDTVHTKIFRVEFRELYARHFRAAPTLTADEIDWLLDAARRVKHETEHPTAVATLTAMKEQQ